MITLLTNTIIAIIFDWARRGGSFPVPSGNLASKFNKSDKWTSIGFALQLTSCRVA